MKRTEKQKARTLLGAFSSGIGSETLNVRIYRDRRSCVCERELVERDGTSFTMVFPFDKLDTLRTLLVADPYYARLRTEIERVLGRVDRALRIYDARSDA
jgi:hypothetical protein